MAIHLDRQRPPSKKMGRKQREGSKSNPRTGVQWANWLDEPGSGGGGGGVDPQISGITPTTVVISSVTTITVNGTNFDAGATIEFNQVAATTAVVTAGSALSASLTAPGTAGTVNVTVRNANEEESNTVALTVTAASADPTSSWLKGEIIEWLIEKGVIVDDGAASHFTKAELLDIVEAYLNGDQDTVDELIGG